MDMKTAMKIVVGLLALLILAALAAVTYIYATALRPSRPVGFQQVTIEDPGHAPLAASIWYPTNARPGIVLAGLVAQRVAVDALVEGQRLPLIVFSHGTGASGTSHVDTALALAERGYVVFAPTHSGDNFRDDGAVGKPNWLPDRARHLRLAIDSALGKWKYAGQLDPERIGVFGFSAGGTTALIALGATPDLRKVDSHCKEHPEFVCKLMAPAAPGPTSWAVDRRVLAAVAVAPGLGFTLAPNGLAAVKAPVQLWAGAADTTVPFATNANVVNRMLGGKAEMHVVPGATHMSFLAPCGWLGPSEFCRDPDGFDRAGFHKSFNESVVKFFDLSLRR
jgi:predicted dienelactone hydrolase